MKYHSSDSKERHRIRRIIKRLEMDKKGGANKYKWSRKIAAIENSKNTFSSTEKQLILKGIFPDDSE